MRIFRFDLSSRRIATMEAMGLSTPTTIFTSRLYPVEVDEAVDAGIELARMLMLTPPLDSVDPQAELVAGSLRAILITHAQPPESVDAAPATLLSGSLRQILLSTAMEPEGVDSSGVLIAGTLRLALITTVMVPEGVDAAPATLIAGTLA